MPLRIDVNSLTTDADEKSSFEVEAAFKDKDGSAFTPKTVTWKLTDVAGATTYASGAETPASTTAILLKGDDLRLSDGFTGQSEKRRLFVKATYDTDAEIDVPLRASCEFRVRNLAAVS